MTFHSPLLSDLSATKTVFKAGDRVLVRISTSLSAVQYSNVDRAVRKYAKADVRVLIIDCTKFKILWEHFDTKQIDTLVSREDVDLHPLPPGIANLDCSVVDLKENDALTIFTAIQSDLQKSRIKDFIQQWAGKEVEVIVLEGQ